MADEFKIGDRVFAKVTGWPPWPAKIVGKVSSYQVKYYGTYEWSIVKSNKIYLYNDENKKKYGKSKDKLRWKEAMDEIEKNAQIDDLVTIKEEQTEQEQSSPEVETDVVTGDFGGTEGTTSTATRRSRNPKVNKLVDTAISGILDLQQYLKPSEPDKDKWGDVIANIISLTNSQIQGRGTNRQVGMEAAAGHGSNEVENGEAEGREVEVAEEMGSFYTSEEEEDDLSSSDEACEELPKKEVVLVPYSSESEAESSKTSDEEAESSTSSSKEDSSSSNMSELQREESPEKDQEPSASCSAAATNSIPEIPPKTTREKKRAAENITTPHPKRVKRDAEKRTALENIPALLKSWIPGNKSMGESSLHRASRIGYPDVAIYLLDNNGDPNSKDNAGYTPLQQACKKGNLMLAKILLKYGADPSQIGHEGLAPLHIAVLNGQVDLVKLLISYGADPTLPTSGGRTPLKLAWKDDVRLLLNQRINAQGKFRDSGQMSGERASDQSTNDDLDGFEFEASEKPLPPLYRLKYSPGHFVLLNEFAKYLDQPEDAILNQLSETDIIKFKLKAFLKRVQCCVSGEEFKCNDNITELTLVKYDDKVKSILDVESCRIK